jgi:hypothetical protein
MKGLPELPDVHENLIRSFAECRFWHLVDGELCGEGSVISAFTKEGLNVFYRHAGEKEGFETVLLLSGLHYDGATRTGFRFGPRIH